MMTLDEILASVQPEVTADVSALQQEIEIDRCRRRVERLVARNAPPDTIQRALIQLHRSGS